MLYRLDYMIRNALIGIVALLHLYFLILEMFLWTKPMGLKTFGMSPEQAVNTAALAANQGLYNGFLVAGLVWALVYPNEVFSKQLAIFFLACVIVAALYGWYSVNIRIFFVQGVPAILALAATLFI